MSETINPFLANLQPTTYRRGWTPTVGGHVTVQLPDAVRAEVLEVLDADTVVVKLPGLLATGTSSHGYRTGDEVIARRSRETDLGTGDHWLAESGRERVMQGHVADARQEVRARREGSEAGYQAAPDEWLPP